MRLVHSALRFGLLLAFATASNLAHADAPAEACSSAYAKGQEDRLAGRLFDARAAFGICAAPTCPAAVARDCQRWKTEVEADLPTLRVRVTDAQGALIPNVQLFADGGSVPNAALSAPIILEAGPHTLRFEANGFRPLEVERALRPTDREVEVSVVLHRTSEPVLAPVKQADSGEPREPLPVLALTLAGVGVVALGSSLYFGLSSHSEFEDLKSSCAPYCRPADADSVRSKALASDIALLASAAAFGAAAWVYFGSNHAQPPVAALSVQPGAQGAALRFCVAF